MSRVRSGVFAMRSTKVVCVMVMYVRVMIHIVHCCREKLVHQALLDDLELQ